MAEATDPWSRALPSSLGEAINISTRRVHAQLNKMIMLRLPLVLPPHESSPSAYVSGLLHITPIYSAFETCWEGILECPSTIRDDAGRTLCDTSELSAGIVNPGAATPGPSAVVLSDPSGPKDATCHPLVAPAIRASLRRLHHPALARRQRLRQDISALTEWSADEVEEQLAQVSSSGWLAEFVDHIQRSIERKPHTLFAYAWVLYMALFAGGRFIRATLEGAGPGFWSQCPGPVRPTMKECGANACKSRSMSTATSNCCCGRDNDGSNGSVSSLAVNAPDRMPMTFRFLRFEGELDGEDVKHEFKQRMREAEQELDESMRDDVLREAACIFDGIIQLVTQLDDACGTPTELFASKSARSAAWRSQRATTTSESSTVLRSSSAESIDPIGETAVGSKGDNGLEKQKRPLGSWIGRNELPLGLKSRDSVVVTKERGERSRMSDLLGLARMTEDDVSPESSRRPSIEDSAPAGSLEASLEVGDDSPETSSPGNSTPTQSTGYNSRRPSNPTLPASGHSSPIDPATPLDEGTHPLPAAPPPSFRSSRRTTPSESSPASSAPSPSHRQTSTPNLEVAVSVLASVAEEQSQRNSCASSSPTASMHSCLSSQWVSYDAEMGTGHNVRSARHPGTAAHVSFVDNDDVGGAASCPGLLQKTDDEPSSTPRALDLNKRAETYETLYDEDYESLASCASLVVEACAPVSELTTAVELGSENVAAFAVVGSFVVVAGAYLWALLAGWRDVGRV